MASCSFKECKNHSKQKNKISGISFHAFPKDKLWNHKWLVSIREHLQDPEWTPTKYSRVCSMHFKECDIYITCKGLRRICKDAVPHFQHKADTDMNTTSRDSPNSLKSVNISDNASIFDTPRKTFLKSKIRKISVVKNKLAQENKNLKRKNKRLTEKCTTLKNTILSLKKKINVPETQFEELCIKAEVADLYTRMIKQKKSQKNIRIKFSPQLRKFALTLNFYSPVGYKYVRQVFGDALPHPRTLGKWYENVDAAPGFTAEAFDVLRKKSSSSGKELICNLVMDEMAIRQQTIWNGRKTLGLVNYGCGSLDVDKVASQAFVMMLVSLNENWKLPVGYFFVDGLTAECKSNLIKICLTKCWDVGVKVVALTFDGCPSNINAVNLLGCQLSNIRNLKTTFKHPSSDMNIAIFLDPCHMIKLVRNSFESKRLIFDSENREIKWQFLENLVKLQSSETLTFGNKLTARHIDFRNQIMKVKLATQLLSRSVAKSLKLCEELLTSSKFQNAEGTVNFIQNFNDLFDILNSRTREKYGFKRPMCQENKDNIIQFLDKMKRYISTLHIYNKTRRIINRKVTITISKKKLIESARKTGFIGFIICIESLKHLYKNLCENNVNLKYIATYRLSQDHLELLFGIIRRQGGYNNNPNVRQFQGIYRKILGHLELKSSLAGNCIPLDNFPILTCSSAVDCINKTVEKNIIHTMDDDNDSTNLILSEVYGSKSFKKYKVCRLESYKRVRDVKYKSRISLASDKEAEVNVEILNDMLNKQCDISVSAEQIIGYIAGWVARALIKTINCETCVSQLITSQKLYFHKLINIRDMGGLCYPSSDLYTICLKSEKSIKTFIKENRHFISERQTFHLKLNIISSFIHSNILSRLELHSLDQPVTFNHRTHLLKAIVDKYCDVRVHYFHKIDPAISTTTKRQKRNKLSLFEGV